MPSALPPPAANSHGGQQYDAFALSCQRSAGMQDALLASSKGRTGGALIARHAGLAFSPLMPVQYTGSHSHSTVVMLCRR